MLRRFSVNYAIISLFLDFSFTLLTLAIAVQLRPFLPQLPFVVPVDEYQLPLVLYVVVPLLWITILIMASVYDPRRIYKAVDEFQIVTIAAGLATLVFAGILYLFFREVSRWLVIIFVALDLAFLLGWRATARAVAQIWRWPPAERRALIIGAGQNGRRMREMMKEYEWTGLRFVGYLDDDPHKQKANPYVLGDAAQARAIVQRLDIDDVIIALPQRAHSKANQLIVNLHELPVQIRVIPDYFSLSLYRASVEDFGGVPMINLRDPAMNEVQRLAKRLFDLLFAGATTFVLLPVMGAVLIAIKLDSVGPVFFRQRRIGENGRPFTMYKFRSMFVGAEKLEEQLAEHGPDGRIRFKWANDARVTRVGRFLRRTSLDELPQLFNVLKGDMSLVGPRPELPWVVDSYDPWQRRRFAVPQGITGWWQVNGRADKPMHEHTEDDLYYIQNYSLWLDIYILLKTFFVVLRGTGAY